MPTRLEMVMLPAASVPTASPGEHNLFVDSADGLVKTKDENGIVTNQAGSSANELNNASANPVILNAGAEPTAVDMVLATTTIGPPHAAAFVSPRARKMASTVLQSAIVDAAANKNAAIDEMCRMDPGTFGGDQTVTLPAPSLAFADREIYVKVVGDPLGNTVSVVAQASGQIDGLANGDLALDLTTYGQWMILRGNLEGTGWHIVG